jgi:malate dehydrogenase
MFEVAIVGAGELGGAIAHRLARRDLVAAIRLIDEAGSIAEGKALDIMQAAPIERFSTRVSGSSELASASAARLVVIADRVAGGEWQDAEGLALLERVRGTSAPLVICAGARQRELIERAARELGLPRTLMLGSAPEALASAVRAAVALETPLSARDISIAVLGVPPHHVVTSWEDALIRQVAGEFHDAQVRRRIEKRVASLWPPGPQALAAAAVKALEIAVGRSRQVVSAFIAPDDSAGRRMRAAAFPVHVGLEGVTAAEMPQLTPHDRVVLETATLL